MHESNVYLMVTKLEDRPPKNGFVYAIDMLHFRIKVDSRIVNGSLAISFQTLLRPSCPLFLLRKVFKRATTHKITILEGLFFDLLNRCALWPRVSK